MTDTGPLPVSLSQQILRHFGFDSTPPPTLQTLEQLVASYTRKAPWESASRIARRARHTESADCVLLGADFWERHFTHGPAAPAMKAITLFSGCCGVSDSRAI